MSLGLLGRSVERDDSTSSRTSQLTAQFDPHRHGRSAAITTLMGRTALSGANQAPAFS
jgi:hypothetical protein